QDSRREAKEEGQQQTPVTPSITHEEYLKPNHKIIRNDVLDVENDSVEDDNTLEYYSQDIESDLNANVFHNAYDIINTQNTPSVQ
ncbi:unnamed protein product, partial [Didymodactylos carnosus]